MFDRSYIYTVSILAMCLFCKLWARRKDQWEGTALATDSGLLIALSNYWVSPFTALIGGFISHDRSSNPTFHNNSMWMVCILFLVAAVLVIGSNVFAIYERQMCFKVGNAATMIPISHVPSHLSSPIIYSLVFWLPQPQSLSLMFMWVGILGVLISSFVSFSSNSFLYQYYSLFQFDSQRFSASEKQVFPPILSNPITRSKLCHWSTQFKLDFVIVSPTFGLFITKYTATKFWTEWMEEVSILS